MDNTANGHDPTLPIDFDGSTNLALLTDVTFGAHVENADGTLSLVTKTSNGRTSPVRARTMKEYDQEITSLKKENFSLKLRIFFLEERVQQKFGDGEDLFKTNIELKVTCESLKQELANKQELLKKASSAMEMLSSNQQKEFVDRKLLEDEVRRHFEKDLQLAYQDLEKQKKNLEEKVLELEEANSEIKNLSKAHNTAKSKIQDLEQDLKELEIKSQREIKSLQDAIEDRKAKSYLRDNLIMGLKNALKEKERKNSEDLTNNQETVCSFQIQLKEKDESIKNLTKSLQTKGEELEEYQELLKKAQTALKESDEAVETLQNQLRDDKAGHSNGSVDGFGADNDLHHHASDGNVSAPKKGAEEFEREIQYLKNELNSALQQNANLQTQIQNYQQDSCDKESGSTRSSLTRSPSPNSCYGSSSPKRLSGSLSPTWEDIRLNRQSLSDLSAPMLRKVIRQLQQQMSLLEKENAELLRKIHDIDNTREVPGANLDDTQCIAALREELKKMEKELFMQNELISKEKQLNSKENELMELENHLTLKENELFDKEDELSSKERELALLEKEMKHEWEDVLRKNKSRNNCDGPSGSAADLSAKNSVINLSVHVGSEEDKQTVLKEQQSLNLLADGHPGGINPELLIRLAQENQHLKDELQRLEKKVNVDTETDSMKMKKTSFIPRPLKPSVGVIPGCTKSVVPENVDIVARFEDLKTKLQATESTVRWQGKKLKYYKSVLNEKGISLNSPMISRSSSESNVNALLTTDNVSGASHILTRNKKALSHDGLVDLVLSGDSFDGRHGGTTYQTLERFGQSDDCNALKRDVEELKMIISKGNMMPYYAKNQMITEEKNELQDSETQTDSMEEDSAPRLIKRMTDELAKKTLQIESLNQQLHNEQQHSDLLKAHIKEKEGIDILDRLTDSPRSNTSSTDGNVVTAPHRRPKSRLNNTSASVQEMASRPMHVPLDLSSVHSPERMRHLSKSTNPDASHLLMNHFLEDLDLHGELANASQTSSVDSHLTRNTGNDVPLPMPSLRLHSDDTPFFDKDYLCHPTSGLDTDYRMNNFRLADRELFTSTSPRDAFSKGSRIGDDSNFRRKVNFDMLLGQRASEKLSPPREENEGRASVASNSNFSQNIQMEGEKDVSHWKTLGLDDMEKSALETMEEDLEIMKAKLTAAEDLNKTLKDEIQIYENLYDSIGAKSPQKSNKTVSSPSKSSQTSSPATSPKKTQVDYDLLRSELAQLKKLRLNLEESMKNSHNLQDRINQNMHLQSSYRESNTTYLHMYSEQQRAITELQHTVEQLQEKINHKDMELQERLLIITEKENVICNLKSKLLDFQLSFDRSTICSRCQGTCSSPSSSPQKNGYSPKENRSPGWRNRSSELNLTCKGINTSIEDWHRQVRQEEKTLQMQEKKIEEQENVIVQLQTKVEEFDEHALKLEQLLQQRLNTINEQQRKIHSLEDDITQNEDLISQKEVIINQKTRTIMELEKTVQTVVDQIKAREIQCHRQEQEIMCLSDRQAQHEQEQVRLQSDNEVLQDRLKKAEDSHRSCILQIQTYKKEIQEIVQGRDQMQKEVSSLTEKCSNAEAEVQKLQAEISRLLRENETLKGKVVQKQKLNDTLKLELSVYEKIDLGEEFSDEESARLIRELLQEIRHLRTQMDKCIEVNAELRIKLEELLAVQTSPRSIKEITNTYHILKENSPARSLVTVSSESDYHPLPESKPNGEKFTSHAYKDSCPPAVLGSSSLLFSSTKSSSSNISYHVNDPPSMVKAMTSSFSVDTDRRNLFALGKIDDYEKLKVEHQESLQVIRELETKIKERVQDQKHLTSHNNEDWKLLKMLTLGCKNLRMCLEEENKIIESFWTSQLPVGENPDLKQENDILRSSLMSSKKQQELMSQMLRETEERLQSTNSQRETMEETLHRQLSRTAKNIVKTRVNLERSTKVKSTTNVHNQSSYKGK